MFVLNLHFKPLIDYANVGRLIDALKFSYPDIVWNRGEAVDSEYSVEELGRSKTIVVRYHPEEESESLFRLYRSRERYFRKDDSLDMPPPIDGWTWIDEVLAKKRNEEGGFEETSGLFNSLNESENKYTNDDLEFFYKNKIFFYEISPRTGVPFEADEFHIEEGIPYDDIGLHIWIGNTKGYYDICWDSKKSRKGYKCMENGPDELIHNLNSGRLIPVDVYRSKYNSTDLFDQLNESEMEERFKSHPLLFSGVVLQPSDGIEGIRTALKLFDSVGVPTREGAKWDQDDIEFVYEDYLLKNEPVFIGVDYSNRTQGEGLYLAWGSPNFFRKRYSESGLKYKFYTLPEFVSLLEGVDFGYSNFFGDLNESKHQPKLNLRFDNPIMYAYELDKVLKVLSDRYPGLQWAGGSPVLEFNPIVDNDLDFTYEPIYYLTIGFFSHKPDKLTYTSGDIDDESYADDEHHMYTWVDGWQWVKDNQINYDETTDTFFEPLNESEDDDLDWARQVVNDVVLKKEGINVGDVFYIVDGGPGTHNIHPDDYTPRDVRYVITIASITEEPFEGEDIKVKYEACDPKDVTYNPKDYSIEKPRCYDYDDGDDDELASGLAWALDLVKKKYWRPMGSSL